MKVSHADFGWEIQQHCPHGQWDFFRDWHKEEPTLPLVGMFRILADAEQEKEDASVREWEEEAHEMMERQGLALEAAIEAEQDPSESPEDAEDAEEAEDAEAYFERELREALVLFDERIAQPIVAVRSGRVAASFEESTRPAELRRAEQMEDLADSWESSRTYYRVV